MGIILKGSWWDSVLTLPLWLLGQLQGRVLILVQRLRMGVLGGPDPTDWGLLALSRNAQLLSAIPGAHTCFPVCSIPLRLAGPLESAGWVHEVSHQHADRGMWEGLASLLGEWTFT